MTSRFASIAAICFASFSSLALGQAPATQPAEVRYTADPKRNVFKAGSFTEIKAGVPVGWDDLSAFDDIAQAQIHKDSGQVLHLETKLPTEPIRIATNVEIDPSWKWLTVASRVRAFDLKPREGGGAAVTFTVLDAAGQPLTTAATFRPLMEGTYRDWSKPTRSFAIPAGAKQLQIEIALIKATGAFEVDDILVVPVDPTLELDADKINAFQTAVIANDAAAVRQMVATDKRYIECRDLDFDGGTPLIITGWRNRPEMASLLLELGADVNAEDRNWQAPAVGWAAFFGRPKVVKILLDAGADVNSVNGEGATALVSAEFGLKGRKGGDATDEERRETIKLLLDRGGNRDTKPKKKP